nr:unnamed protein product [Spirometra erinaceieuropaei]
MARPQDTALARFYGLPKVHKDGAPLRPIVSLKGTPTYGLAKWLFRRLKFLTAESDTTVSSSAQFLEKLKGDLAIETIELLLQSKYDETENRLGHAKILQLMKLCLRTYFTFDGTIYEQVKGTPMGSPISGFIAEALLQRLESLVFQHHRPKFWARYVDDTFVVIERDQVLTFQEHLNAVFPDIQVTMEEEENNQLAFLDVLVCRKDCGGLKTKVFRKATNTMQFVTDFGFYLKTRAVMSYLFTVGEVPVSQSATRPHNLPLCVLDVNGHSGHESDLLDISEPTASLELLQPSSPRPPLPRPLFRQLTLTLLLHHHFHPPPSPPLPQRWPFRLPSHISPTTTQQPQPPHPSRFQ